MLTRECTHILPNGRACRAPAISNLEFCRHHAPKPAQPGPPPIPKHHRYSTIARWRSLRRNLQWLDAAEIPLTIYEILDSLTGRSSDRISDLAAGQYLRALLERLGQVPFPPPQIEQPDPAPMPAQLSPAPTSQPAPHSGPPIADNVRAAFATAFPSGLTAGTKLGPDDFDALVRAFGQNGIVPPSMMPARVRPSPVPISHSHVRVNQ